jgi:hypothetical protein
VAVDRHRGELPVEEREASEAAVPDDLERHALVDRARRPRIDEEREVRVAVDVDEPRRDHLAGRIDLLPRLRNLTDRDDAAAVDADVRALLGGARPVDDHPVPHGEVDHAAFRPRRASAVAIASMSPSTTTTP